MEAIYSHNSKVYIPCRPNCSDRSATCHAECAKYKQYLEEKKVEAEAKEKIFKAVKDSIEYRQDFRRRYMKKHGGK